LKKHNGTHNIENITWTSYVTVGVLAAAGMLMLGLRK